MKNITLSAEDRLIEAARAKAREQHTTLNAEFRRWLAEYVQQQQQAETALALIADLQKKARTGGRHFSRDEMNER
ncbi:MAG: hypothetical protein WD572_10185 [Gammaproteobacteria bacterium]